MISTSYITRFGRIPIVGGGAILGLLATTAYADSLSPLLIPGFSASSAGWGFLILATLLAAWIEIPYVARAGVQERVWRRTLVANVISTVAGLLFPAYAAAYSDQVNVYIALAIALSILLEGAYLTWAASRRLNWGWLAVANVTSSVVLLWLSSIWAVSMDRAPDALRNLGADVLYSWYERTHLVRCVNPKLVDDVKITQWAPHLSALDVKHLNLSGSRITDLSLKTLAEVHTLTFLDVTSTRVTRQGVEALQAALPRVVVYPFNEKEWTLPAGSANTEQPQHPPSADQPSG